MTCSYFKYPGDGTWPAVDGESYEDTNQGYPFDCDHENSDGDVYEVIPGCSRRVQIQWDDPVNPDCGMVNGECTDGDPPKALRIVSETCNPMPPIEYGRSAMRQGTVI